MGDPLRASVIVPSAGRPAALARCLASLAAQTESPLEVIVVWQAEDEETRAAAERSRVVTSLDIRVVHSKDRNIVHAENAGLRASRGDIILMIDDDASAPPTWIAQHLSHYRDATIGAVGGPIRNHLPDGTPFASRSVEPVGRITWYGRTRGNHYDHPAQWSERPPRDVDHLMGPNMSLRRSAFSEFETGLREYWQMFELDACLQVRRSGLRIVFDFANTVDHHPTNTAFAGGRDGDLTIKVYHAAYNHAFVLGKHSSLGARFPRLLYLLLVGSVATPGVLGFFVAVRRYGHSFRELKILVKTLAARIHGWQDGSRAATR